MVWKLGVCQICFLWWQIHFLTGFDSQGDFNEDPAVWLDGARPPPISLFVISANSWFDQLGHYEFIYQHEF
jgi:hypothetical protein